MAVYMVERELPGISMDQLAAAHKALLCHLRACGRCLPYLWSSCLLRTRGTPDLISGFRLMAKPAGLTDSRLSWLSADIVLSALPKTLVLVPAWPLCNV